MAGLLAVACLLHVLGGVARAGVVGQNGVWKNTNNLNGGGCSRCDLDQMVKDCPLDVEFMLDMSDSVSPRDYERAREYVARQMRAVTDAFQGTQVGFLAFSNIVHTDIDIRPRSPIELQQLTGLVQTLAQQRYGTQLADALRRARQVLAAHNGTTLVPGGQRGKLIVLVSDGCPDNDRAVKKEAIQAHLDGIAIVSVQLDDAYLDLLKAISIQVLELRTDIDWSSVVACPAHFLPPITRTDGVCGDFVIAMDGSDSVRRWEKVMRDYLAYTAMRYSYQTNAMGVVVFGTNVTSQSSDTMIKPKRDKLQLAEQIEKKLSFPNERGTGTTQAIREATAFLRELALSGDPNLNRTLMVITDGPALNPQSARQALASARSEGFQVVVIGVGDTLTPAELQRMAGQSFVVRVDSYLDLFTVNISQYICKQGRCQDSTPCPRGQTRDVDCICRCPDRRPCPNGQTRDVNCQCKCPQRQCPYCQVLNNDTCQCESLPIQCPRCQVLNTQTCQCESVQRQCPRCQVLNTETCQCESLQRQCPRCQVLNTETCQCESLQRQCPRCQVLNTETCQCESLQRQCPRCQVLNTETCQCESLQRQCPRCQVLNTETCQCESLQRQCPRCQVLNTETCQCESLPRQCPHGQVLNNETCQCECPLGPPCPFRQDFNNQTCQCECRPRWCPSRRVQNPQTCECDCSSRSPCTRLQRWNPDTCRCECSPSQPCRNPQVLNNATCQCECLPRQPCPYPKIRNTQNCQCECPRQTCRYPHVVNNGTCRCECPSRQPCGYPYVLNNATCQCGCNPNIQCNAMQRLNPNTCQCDCLNSCRACQIQDPNTCECRCSPNIRCTGSQVLNQTSCKCECTSTCPRDRTQDPITCQCGCNRFIRCKSYQRLDLNTCQCVCRDTCPQGEQNPQTCICSGQGFCDRVTCPSNQKPNPQNQCQCECPTRRCNPPQVLNNQTCQCEECIQRPCTTGYFWNSWTCQCECQRQCTPPQVLNTQTGQCECPTRRCNPPQVLNNQTCQCEECIQRPCATGYVWNSWTCQCECQRQCTLPQVLNTQTCQCGCNRFIRCKSYQRLDLNTCQCVCRDTCPQGEQNPQTCICPGHGLCDRVTCPSNQQPNPQNQCQCECHPRRCNPPQVLNSQTCQCEGCIQRLCATGYFWNSWTCQCEPEYTPRPTPYTPPPMPTPTGPARKCSPSKYRCQNNQPATEDCEGRCICHCDTSLYAGFYCDLPVRPSLCDNCTFTNGHYLAGVEGRCDLFVVCQPTGNGGYLPHIRDCPPGTIFKQNGTLGRALCDFPLSSGSCPTDPCRRLPAYAKYPDSRNCNHYWQCDANGRTASSGCCPPGQGFDRAQATCVPDSNCPNDCDPNFRSCSLGHDLVPSADSCPYEALASDPKKFVNPAAPGLYQSCAPTDIFNETLCRCVKNPNVGCTPYYDINFDDLDQGTNGFDNVEIRSSASLAGNGNVGCFGGNSRIILYRFSDSGYNLDYFEVSLRVKLENLNLRPGQEMAIVSNGDCGGEETLAITVDRQYVYFKVKSSGGDQVHVVKVSYTATSNGWLDIKFQYERKGTSKLYLMTGTVNGQSESVTLIGVIGHTKCALQLGHGQASSSLTACVDDFKVWKCKL